MKDIRHSQAILERFLLMFPVEKNGVFFA